MKIGIYAPDLSAYGGGEKYICKIAEILNEKNDVEFIIFENPDIKGLEERLSVDLSGVGISEFEIPYIIKVLRLHKHMKNYMLKNITKKYDIFINQDINTVIPANATKNFYICQVPPTNIKRSSLEKIMGYLFFDIKLQTYDKIVVYSTFVKKWVEKYYNNRIEVLSPPIDIEKFSPGLKSDIILSVGRFFTGAHSKKQLEMIRAFKKLYDEIEILNKWEYHLAGGVGDILGNQEYLELCKKEAEGYPIFFHINTPLDNLSMLYSKAKIFWHGTGFGEDENKNPESMEHFGITTGEAMAAGCVPVVINKGGQPEIVRHQIDGFLWNDEKELKLFSLKLIEDKNLWELMNKSAIKRSKDFGMEKFIENSKNLFKL